MSDRDRILEDADWVEAAYGPYTEDFAPDEIKNLVAVARTHATVCLGEPSEEMVERVATALFLPLDRLRLERTPNWIERQEIARAVLRAVRGEDR